MLTHRSHRSTGQKGGLAMRKFLLGTVGLAAMLASPAMAADMRVAPPPPPVVYYDWTGAYIGANIGGAWNTVYQTFPNPQFPRRRRTRKFGQHLDQPQRRDL